MLSPNTSTPTFTPGLLSMEGVAHLLDSRCREANVRIGWSVQPSDSAFRFTTLLSLLLLHTHAARPGQARPGQARPYTSFDTQRLIFRSSLMDEDLEWTRCMWSIFSAMLSSFDVNTNTFVFIVRSYGDTSGNITRASTAQAHDSSACGV